MSTQWDAAFEASPAGGDSPALGDNKITELKSATRERGEKEHDWAISTGTYASHGWHKLGSAKVYYGTSAPTVRPDTSTALTSADAGRIWINSATYAVQVYTGTAWVGVASNNLYTETITGSNTFAAFGTDSVITLSNASAAGVSIANGASLPGISLTLLKTTSTAVTLTTASGVTFNFTAGILNLIWTGSAWLPKGKQNQRVLLTSGSSATWKSPFKGLYLVYAQGGGGSGGSVVGSTDGTSACGGGSGGNCAGKWYSLASGISCTYTVGGAAQDTTFTDGSTSIKGQAGLNGTGGNGGEGNLAGGAAVELDSSVSTADFYYLGTAGTSGAGLSSGKGGHSYFGGVADAVTYVSPNYVIDGITGKGYGGGGGGAFRTSTPNTTATGGVGGPGCIVIEF